jgi:hypothetical protein
VETDASDDELISAVRSWVDLLAIGDFAAAARFLHPPTAASDVEGWTADSLETYIANHGSWEPLDDGRRMRVTPIESAGGSLTPRFEVNRNDDRPPSIEFDLPLDGEWSDLTALFELVEVDGKWAFTLYDLHVL